MVSFTCSGKSRTKIPYGVTDIVLESTLITLFLIFNCELIFFFALKHDMH
jgi:hypothetical protein